MIALLLAGVLGPTESARRNAPAKRIQHPLRIEAGQRLPDPKVFRALLETLSQILLGTRLILPGESKPMNDAQRIRAHFQKTLQAVFDAVAYPMQPTTVIDLESRLPTVVRIRPW